MKALKERRIPLPDPELFDVYAAERIVMQLTYEGPYARISPGPHKFTPQEVASTQRARMVRSMAEAVRKKGLKTLIVSDILELSGCSRKAFYINFVDKMDCFLWTLHVTRAYLGLDWEPTRP